MKKIILIISVLFFCLKIQSQKINYSGIIVNSKNSDKNYIITLTSKKDSTETYSESSYENKYSFNNLEKGQYKRCILFESSKKCDFIELSKDNISDTVFVNLTEVKEVVITARKPIIQNKNGVLQVNVENSSILSTGSVFDALNKMPGVSFNSTGNTFKLKGKDNVQIQIDGQSLYLSGAELSTYLKTISANDISSIDINSSPSSKYEASGNGGIINIKTKKITREGFYAGLFFNGTQGKYFKEDAGTRLQYNTKKSRFMLHYVNANNINFEEAKTSRIFYENNSTNQYTFAKIKGNTNTINSQYEHQFKKSNLLLSSSISFYKENINQNTNTDFFNNSKIKDSSVISNQLSNNKLKDYTFGVNYKINGKKSNVVIKANYVLYNITNMSDLSSYSTPSDYSYPNLINKSPNKINLFLFQTDYEYKPDSLSKIELGVKSILQNIRNNNNFYTQKNEQEYFDSDKSNDYNYNEWIIGSYLQYNRKINKFDFTTGLRLEQSYLNGTNQKNNYEIRRNKANLFPFFNLEFDSNDNNNFNLSYSKRINRPRFKNLMPFEYYVDPYTKLLGNPNLLPTISHQIELQYILHQKYIFSVDYTFQKNQIFQTPFQNNESLLTTLTPVNIKNGSSITFSVNSTFDFTKWWYCNFNGQLFYDRTNSSNNNIYINRSLWSTQLVVINQFKLPQNFKFEIISNYTSPVIQGPYETKNIFTTSLGLSNSFFKKNLTVAVTANDIFETYKVTNNTIVQGLSSNIQQKFDTRWFRLSLVYKFYSGIKKDNRQSDELTNEIKSRTK